MLSGQSSGQHPLAGMPGELGADKTVLGKLSVDDLELIHRLFSNDYISRRVLLRPAVRSERVLRKILDKLLFLNTYKISTVGKDKAIGIIGVVSNNSPFAGDMNLFIGIEHKYQRRGLGTVAFRHFARELFRNASVETISAWVNLDLVTNPAPVYRSWGFVPNLMATTHYFMNILHRSKRRLPALGCYTINREAFFSRFAEEYMEKPHG